MKIHGILAEKPHGTGRNAMGKRNFSSALSGTSILSKVDGSIKTKKPKHGRLFGA
jgi:hypothetical protein